METKKKDDMILLTNDLWAIVLVRFPLRFITTCKLVCKQWKSLAESQLFRELFSSHHQNSHSSWSLMYYAKSQEGYNSYKLCGAPRSLDSQKEVVGYYACKVWGLQRSLDFYISSLIREKFESCHSVKVKAYTDVGLILICTSLRDDSTYYVANLISRQCVEIPPPPTIHSFRPAGLATRIENDVVLAYKVVLMDVRNFSVLSLLIYSSETGLWSFNTLQSHLPLCSLNYSNPISLNRNLYWVGMNIDYDEVVLSHEFYSTGTESDRYQVTLFPDVQRHPIIKRVCTSQGFIMYMSIVSEHIDVGHKLRVWRLKSGEWQLVYEISPRSDHYWSPFHPAGFDFIPLTINPFDTSTMYMWSNWDRCVASTNLYGYKFGPRSYFELSNNYRALSTVARGIVDDLSNSSYYESDFKFSMFVLPRWLHQIPSIMEKPKMAEKTLTKTDEEVLSSIPAEQQNDNVPVKNKYQLGLQNAK